MMITEKLEDDNLLMEIFLVLPPKSIYRFLSVSKRWNNTLRDPFFLQNYSKKRRRSGRLLALIGQNFHISKRDLPIHILPIHGIPGIRRIKYILKQFGYFVNSSNGLILCSSTSNRYTVLNPITKRWVSLPPASPRSILFTNVYTFDGLMCEENINELASNYVVVRSSFVRGTIMQIETYSSKTGNWSESTLIATGKIGCPRQPPIVANGVFHWIVSNGTVAVYDPNDGLNHVQLIELPYVNAIPLCCFHENSVGRSLEDALWYGAIDIGEMNMKFWVLNKGSRGRTMTISRDEWVLMYDICLELVCRGVKIKRTRMRINPMRRIDYERHEPRLEGFFSWNPLVVVLRLNEKRWFLYNLETESCELVRYYDCVVETGCGGRFMCPFIESLFLSSYAL